MAVIFPYYSGDVNNHIAWGKSLVENGLDGFYKRDFDKINIAFPTYGPVGMLPLGLFYFLFEATTKLVWNLNLTFPLFPSKLVYLFNFDNRNMLAAYLKIPAIFGDLLTGLFIFLFAKNIFRFKNAGIFSALYLFNPAVFYLSANWGQIDSLALALVLGAFYFLFSRKFNSAVTFMLLGLLVKQTVIFLLPLFLIVVVLNFRFRQIVKSGVFAMLLFLIFYLPFFRNNPLKPFSFYLQTFSYVSNRVQENAFNLWYFVFAPDKPFDFNNFFNLSYRTWGILMFAILALPSLLLVTKRKDPKTTILAAGYLMFIAFLFLTRIHQRYLAFTLPFFLLISGFNPVFWLAYFGISVIHLFNLYTAFFQPDLPFLTNLLANLNFVRFLILINFVVFTYLLTKIVKSLHFTVLLKRK